MAKKTNRTNNNAQEYNEAEFGSPASKILGDKFRLKCKNEAQKEFVRIINEHEIVIAAGPSGTGKSYLSIGRAIELLQNVSNPYNKIIICKPAVEAEEKIGFIPGTEREKLEPHIASSLDIIDKMIGQFSRMRLEEKGILVIQPLGYIRGKTLDNAIIIIEEAQNLSPNQCKTILTRIGSNSKLIISGDIDQSDKYKNLKETGLYDIITRHKNIPEIGFFEFSRQDIVRNPIITKILNNYPQLGELDILKDCITPEIKRVEQAQIVIPNEEVRKDQQRLFDKITSFLPNYR
jgi:phosphate starvation-inducible protein PhoH and related proteins